MSTNTKNKQPKWVMTILNLFRTSGSLSPTVSAPLQTITKSGKPVGSFVPEEDISYANFLAHLELREGKRNKVYLDSLGYPTVGVGHLVLKTDGLKVGDTISNERIREFLIKDSQRAWDAAKAQAKDLNRPSDWAFVEALGSVNFQLGTGWPKTFHATYEALKAGNKLLAISKLKKSLWAKQTPVRVQDFILAIDKAF